MSEGKNGSLFLGTDGTNGSRVAVSTVALKRSAIERTRIMCFQHHRKVLLGICMTASTAAVPVAQAWETISAIVVNEKGEAVNPQPYLALREPPPDGDDQLTSDGRLRTPVVPLTPHKRGVRLFSEP